VVITALIALLAVLGVDRAVVLTVLGVDQADDDRNVASVCSDTDSGIAILSP
jgi:hypothetical protein